MLEDGHKSMDHYEKRDAEALLSFKKHIKALPTTFAKMSNSFLALITREGDVSSLVRLQVCSPMYSTTFDVLNNSFYYHGPASKMTLASSPIYLYVFKKV